MRSLVPLVVLALLTVSTQATADDNPSVAAEEDGYVAGVREENEVDPIEQTTDDAPLGTYRQEPACEGVCTGELTCPDGTFKTHSWYVLPDGSTTGHSYWCPAEGPPQVTEGLVAQAFQRIPLPPSTFTIQPPGGQTLVNFATNFYTEERTLDRTVRLLGQRVDLRIEAHSYTWHFGDGESVTTEEPGAPYPKLRITHDYLQIGDYAPSMDTTWVADYRVNGGAWQAVPGSVTIEGDPNALEAIEARPTLVGYDG